MKNTQKHTKYMKQSQQKNITLITILENEGLVKENNLTNRWFKSKREEI